MKVLVTGATGFTGSYTVPVLIDRGLEVRCFVRPASDLTPLPLDEVELAYGDLNDPETLVAALDGVDGLINIASLGFGHAPTIVNGAVEQGVRRAVFISTTSIFTTLNASSKGVRLAAEETIKQSGLAYTILRPTMIYGSARDRNLCRLIRYLNRYPILPIFGAGAYLQQPVYVGDVAQALVDALLTDSTVGEAYNIAGKTAVTYNELVDTVCHLLDRKVLRLHVPVAPFVKGLHLAERLSLPLPIKGEQILRLNENKNFAYTKATTDFGYSPRSLVEGLSLELTDMGLL